MNDSMFEFELKDKLAPVEVIENALKQIQSATHGYVTGNIKEYNGRIASYQKNSGLGTALKVMQSTEPIVVDIQEDLGVLDSTNNRYEVFLSVKGLEHYKYRIMFVDYGTISYPVTIVLNEDMAKVYSGRRNSTYSIESMIELESLLNKILNSDTMVALIQSLINEAIRQGQ